MGLNFYKNEEDFFRHASREENRKVNNFINNVKKGISIFPDNIRIKAQRYLRNTKTYDAYKCLMHYNQIENLAYNMVLAKIRIMATYE